MHRTIFSANIVFETILFSWTLSDFKYTDVLKSNLEHATKTYSLYLPLDAMFG